MKVEDMFNKSLNNSIGNEKKVKKQFIKKKFVQIPLAILAGTIIAISVTGCGLLPNATKGQDVYDQYMNISQEYGVSVSDVNKYQVDRLYELLDKNNINKYENNGPYRKYYATEDDYKMVEGLDESYLCTLYITSGRDAANEMAKSLGFENLDDFLIKNNYTDKNGNANYRLWTAANSVYMAKQMTSQDANKSIEGGKAK